MRHCQLTVSTGRGMVSPSTSFQPGRVGVVSGPSYQSPGVNYRARVYGVSPRHQNSHLPNHLARRLAQGASTFT